VARLQVETVINGENKEFLCDANQSMLDVLRDELGLTGTKEGCGTAIVVPVPFWWMADWCVRV